MKFFFAPMEGITRYVYRNAHARFYPGMDRYYSPFLSPKDRGSIMAREKKDILPENNEGLDLVPQILARDPERFLMLAARLKAYGYNHVNLNLGCPSGTVVSKGKGCGFLEDPEALAAFFERIFEECPMEVSVKTRLGMHDPEEMGPIMEVFNSFPLKEVIIHARVRDDYYKNKVNLAAFCRAAKDCRHPVCYNGDISSPEDYRIWRKECPSVRSLMIGRGLIANPQLAEQIRENTERDLDRLEAFMDCLAAGYEEIMSGDRNTLFKLKEVWTYMLPEFRSGAPFARKIRKVRTLSEYRHLIRELFERERGVGYAPQNR